MHTRTLVCISLKKKKVSHSVNPVLSGEASFTRAAPCVSGTREGGNTLVYPPFLIKVIAAGKLTKKGLCARCRRVVYKVILIFLNKQNKMRSVNMTHFLVSCRLQSVGLKSLCYTPPLFLPSIVLSTTCYSLYYCPSSTRARFSLAALVFAPQQKQMGYDAFKCFWK